MNHKTIPSSVASKASKCAITTSTADAIIGNSDFALTVTSPVAAVERGDSGNPFSRPPFLVSSEVLLWLICKGPLVRSYAHKRQLRNATSNHRKAAMKTVLIALLAAGILAATASAEWTPAKPGDPRTCKFASADRPGYCGDIASRLAFQAKYLRVTGNAFVGSLRCPQAAPLTFMCAWKNALGAHQTVVRFAHKASGWKVAVGVIPAG